MIIKDNDNLFYKFIKKKNLYFETEMKSETIYFINP